VDPKNDLVRIMLAQVSGGSADATRSVVMQIGKHRWSEGIRFTEEGRLLESAPAAALPRHGNHTATTGCPAVQPEPKLRL